MDYSDFVVQNCPNTVIYIPNFITSEEENYLMSCIDNAPKPKWTQLSHRRLLNYGGVPHKNGMIAEEIPKWLQTYIDKINNLGIFHDRKANHVLVNEYLPGQGIMPHFDGPLFYPIISTISCGSHTILELHKPANDYNVEYSEILNNVKGQDDEKRKCENKLTSKSNDHDNDDDGKQKTDSSDSYQILIEPRSLLMIKDDAYHKFLHSIMEKTEDIICNTISNLANCENVYDKGKKLKRGRRISLTIRHVPKTSKMKLKFGI